MTAQYLLTAKADCIGSCINAADLHQTIVRSVPGKQNLVYGGRGWLSGNGRYFVGFTVHTFSGYTQVYRVDLATGELSKIQLIRGSGVGGIRNGRLVVDNGDFVLVLSGRIHLFRNGQLNLIPGRNDTPNSYNPVIDAKGDTVVYLACCSPNSQLRILHADSGEDGILYRGDGNVYQPVISPDGTRVAFLATAQVGTLEEPAPAQVCMINADGTELRTVTDDPYGIAEFAISDDGQTIWYVNATGALYQLSVASGEAQQRIAPMCKVSPHDGMVISPGSALAFGGGSLGPDFKATFDGIPGPFISRSSSGMWVQVP